jgi:excisionase family DNA binding protein
MAERLMTIAEAADALRVSSRTVYRAIARRQIVTTDVAVYGQPRLRIAESALDAYVARRQIKGRAA